MLFFNSMEKGGKFSRLKPVFKVGFGAKTKHPSQAKLQWPIYSQASEPGVKAQWATQHCSSLAQLVT